MTQTDDIQVLFSDDALLVINKPAGLPSLPDGYIPSLPHVKNVLEKQFGRLWIVHRLDKETSGVLLLARSAEAHRSLNTQFEQRQVSKVYHALLVGNPAWREQTVDLPLHPNGDRHHRTVVDQLGGKPAITHIKVLERFTGYCLLEARPETGRTHQIRAHLLSLGMTIIGDKLYGKHVELDSTLNIPTSQAAQLTFPWPAQCIGLHARFLEITHPLTGERLKFSAPYPVYFTDALLQLRKDENYGD